MDPQWSLLPEHILIKILRYMSMSQAYHVSLTCRQWSKVFREPQLWRIVEFHFTRGTRDEKYLRALDEYGIHFRSLILRIDQSDQENRRLGVEFLKRLSLIKDGQLRRCRFEFIGTNPLFYGGQEFVDALQLLFDCNGTKSDHFDCKPPKNDSEEDQNALQSGGRENNVSKSATREKGSAGTEAREDEFSKGHALEYVDLSRAPIMYTDDLLLCLSQNHFSTLRYLNIQTKQYVCKIQPECMLYVAERCKQLVDLRVCHSSLSNEVLLAFATSIDRIPLRHLSILCRRQEKYFHHDLTELTWSALNESSPNLDVTLKFDPTCPLEKVREIMKPHIPVRHLYLETYINAHELALAVQYYHNTLRKLIIQAKSSPLLESALLDAAEWCQELSSLHVMCLLEEYTVEEILRRRVELTKNRNNYTLKYQLEQYPWVTDEILDELPEYAY